MPSGTLRPRIPAARWRSELRRLRLENNNGDLTRRDASTVAVEEGHQRRLLVVQARSLWFLSYARSGTKRSWAVVDGHVRVRDEVELPVGVAGGAALGRDHHD